MKTILNKINNMLARATVSASNSGGKLQTLQVKMLAGEQKSDVEHFEPYGFSSNPPDGAEAFVSFIEGDRSHGIVLSATDRRVRIRNLQKGAIGIGFNDHPSVIINPDGSVTITATTINIAATTINSQGNWLHTGDIKADGISLKTHKHSDPQGGQTGTPV